MLGILLLAKEGCNLGCELLQMTIDAGVALRMVNVDGIAKTKHAHGHH